MTNHDDLVFPRSIQDTSVERIDIRLCRHLEAGTLPKELLIDGPAGTGKTYPILTFLHLLLTSEPNLAILICRATRKSLTDSVLRTFENEILPADGMASLAHGCSRRTRQSYLYPNGSELVLGGLDNPTKVLSQAWDVIYVNEAIETNETDWETLKSRLNRPGRHPGLGFLLGDTNPGQPSHWLKKRCDSGKTVRWETCHKANPRLWSRDRGEWTDEAIQYVGGTLGSLTGSRRKRLLEGEWSVGEGLWFESFNAARHVTEFADYDPALPVFLSCDPGVFTGAVLWQERENSKTKRCNVFADYLSENMSARDNAAAIKALAKRLGVGRITLGYCDPAGGARNPIGPTVVAEYEAAGLPLRSWARANPSVADSLENVEVMLCGYGGMPRLTIHPRCRHLIDAFHSYTRAKRADQWMDYPQDPQHPAEDLIDALRGGLWARFRTLRTLKLV